MIRRFASCVVLFAAALLTLSLRAEISLAPLFRDGMVMQRDVPHPVWGRAEAGERVEVRLLAQMKTAVADRQGRWQVVLDPLSVSTKAATLKVSGKSQVSVRDILVGDVWLCSGQSNMEWAVSTALNPEKEAEVADFPLIRHCKVTRTVAEHPAEEVAAVWQACSPATVLRFSAVGYFFARDQHLKKGVPIGIVTSAWGGTPIESWISEETLKGDRDFAVIFARWRQLLLDYPAEEAKQLAAIAQWEQEAAAAKAAGQPFKSRKPMPAEGPGSRWLPGGLFNGMIHPLVPFPFKGVLWYQGEANEFRAAEYGKLFRTMISQWRRAFGHPDLPFYFVQLANFATRNDPTGQTWAFLREAQAEALTLPHTGMVVAADIGDDKDIHFKNKQEVGRRLSLLARAKLDGEQVASTGPVFAGVEMLPGKLRVKFRQAQGLENRSGLNGDFQIAAEDQIFHPAEVRVDGDTVTLQADAVPAPVAVRYGWSNTPRLSLFNGAGLPAAPFRSDNWPTPALPNP
jgi:sialate O-acetylesterase